MVSLAVVQNLTPARGDEPVVVNLPVSAIRATRRSTQILNTYGLRERFEWKLLTWKLAIHATATLMLFKSFSIGCFGNFPVPLGYLRHVGRSFPSLLTWVRALI